MIEETKIIEKNTEITEKEMEIELQQGWELLSRTPLIKFDPNSSSEHAGFSIKYIFKKK